MMVHKGLIFSDDYQFGQECVPFYNQSMHTLVLCPAVPNPYYLLHTNKAGDDKSECTQAFLLLGRADAFPLPFQRFLHFRFSV